LCIFAGLIYLSWTGSVGVYTAWRSGAVRTGWSVGVTVFRSKEPERYWLALGGKTLRAAICVALLAADVIGTVSEFV
jgi:hypothetical protein